MIYLRQKTKGFSLIEMLLVLAIMASVLVALLGYTTQKSDEMRRDRTVMQMEQFLNAGLSYYVSFGSWPTQVSDLQTKLFMPTGTIRNGWGQTFTVGDNADSNPGTGSQFSVCTTVIGHQAFSAATIIAGRLPIAKALDGGAETDPCPRLASTQACTTSSTSCTIESSVNIPGQNLNNARSINFAGLYHNGACVPAPSCPSSNMQPIVMVIPVSVSGMNDPSSPTDIYPLSSFTAYVTGTNASDLTPTDMPGDCVNDTSSPCYQDSGGTRLPTGQYWRACLRIITQRGTVQYAASTKDAGIILALTRCVPQNEYNTPSVHGSDFTVFSQ